MIGGQLNSIAAETVDDDLALARHNGRAIVSTGLDPLGTANVIVADAVAQSVHQAFDEAQGAQSTGDPTGQLWLSTGGPGTGNSDSNTDGLPDMRVFHMDSDGIADDRIVMQTLNAGSLYQAIGLDAPANIYIVMDNSYNMSVHNLTTGAQIGAGITVASTADGDLYYQFVVDAKTNTLWGGLFGYDYTTSNPAPYGATLHGADLIKITYNPTTGAISSPYTFNDTTHTGSVDMTKVLLNSGSTGNVYADFRSGWLSPDGATLYYVDDNDA